MINIIAASRLRKTLKSNVFFGGVGGVITDESILNSNLSFTVVSDIEDFKINKFKDVICYINKNWGLTAGDFANKANLRFIIDLDGNFKQGIGNDNLRNAYALEFIFGENIGQNSSIASNAFQNNGIMYLPSARTFDNQDRSVGGGGIIFFDSFIENDTGITLDKLRASTHELIFIQNYNKPAPITNFTVTKVGSTYAKITLTFPSHSNIMRFIEVWRLGSFFTISQDETEIIITGLNPSSNNQIEIFVADQYYNRSLGYKQSILTQATDITITEVNTGGTYVEFSINNTTSFTVTEVEVYANGFLNTISNQYVVNLNELTSYNIEVIAKTSEGADLISNTINVTTTTTPALFQNAVAYYKLDETSGNAIDVINSYNGTLFGGVTQGVAGKIGTAIESDGLNTKYFKIPKIAYSENAFYISGWFYFSSANNYGLRLINRGNINKGFNVQINADVNVTYFGVAELGAETSGAIENELNHFIIEKTNNEIKVYVNNVLRYTKTNNYLISENDLYFNTILDTSGNVLNDDSQPFILDEIDLRDTPYALSERSDLYNNGNGTTI